MLVGLEPLLLCIRGLGAGRPVEEDGVGLEMQMPNFLIVIKIDIIQSIKDFVLW